MGYLAHWMAEPGIGNGGIGQMRLRNLIVLAAFSLPVGPATAADALAYEDKGQSRPYTYTGPRERSLSVLLKLLPPRQVAEQCEKVNGTERPTLFTRRLRQRLRQRTYRVTLPPSGCAQWTKKSCTIYVPLPKGPDDFRAYEILDHELGHCWGGVFHP